jgi:Rieske Fe-S protein
VTHGVVAGLLLANLVQARRSKWAEAYRPSRKTLDAAGRYIADNAIVAQNMLGYLTPGEISAADKLKPGKGAILRSGLDKLAVCRDLKGKLHVHSASCTHIGCLIRWNSFEQCWDCPCHGSHFAPNGEALNAPAINTLSAADLPLGRDRKLTSSSKQDTRRRAERHSPQARLP